MRQWGSWNNAISEQTQAFLSIDGKHKLCSGLLEIYYYVSAVSQECVPTQYPTFCDIMVHATTCYLTVLRADSLLLVCVDVCKGRLDEEVQ